MIRRLSFCLYVSTIVYFMPCTLSGQTVCGPQWLAPPTGLNGSVRCAISYDPDGAGPLPPVLVVGGFFNQAGNAVAQYIAAWDGMTWSALGDGFNEGVLALAV